MRRPYRSAHRDAQARRTRQRVIAAATAVFLETGFSGATMRAVAAAAAVSVPTVELVFGTKAQLLKAAIDVAIAGDDEAVPVLDRPWAKDAAATQSAEDFLAAVAAVIGPAQRRSAGLVLALFEGSSTDATLADLADQMITQRRTTAAWIVDGILRRAPLQPGCSRQEAIDTVWVLMDPAVFVRLTRHRRWSRKRYERWLARSIGRLLIGDAPGPHSTARTRRSS
jgi:AcrR family transcriptional regulator